MHDQASTDLIGTRQSVVIGRGAHGHIELDVARGIVSKLYTASDAGAVLQREYDALSRFGAALNGQPHVRCPQVLGIDQTANTLWMTYCSGTPIDALLADRKSGIDEDLPHIANQIRIAITTWIAEFGTPYYDLALWNLLYDPKTRTLSLVDFASDGYFGQRFDHLPVEASLGKLAGGSIYLSVRPTTWLNTRYRDRQHTLIRAVLTNVRQNAALDMKQLASLSARTYNGMGKSGSPARQLWYRTIGQFLYARSMTRIISAAHGMRSGR